MACHKETDGDIKVLYVVCGGGDVSAAAMYGAIFAASVLHGPEGPVDWFGRRTEAGRSMCWHHTSYMLFVGRGLCFMPCSSPRLHSAPGVKTIDRVSYQLTYCLGHRTLKYVLLLILLYMFHSTEDAADR